MQDQEQPSANREMQNDVPVISRLRNRTGPLGQVQGLPPTTRRNRRPPPADRLGPQRKVQKLDRSRQLLPQRDVEGTDQAPRPSSHNPQVTTRQNQAPPTSSPRAQVTARHNQTPSWMRINARGAVVINHGPQSFHQASPPWFRINAREPVVIQHGPQSSHQASPQVCVNAQGSVVYNYGPQSPHQPAPPPGSIVYNYGPQSSHQRAPRNDPELP